MEMSNDVPLHRATKGEEKLNQNVPSKTAFEKLVRIIRNYGSHVDYQDVHTIDDVVRIFVNMSECPGAFLDYRGVINHLLRYLKSRKLVLQSIDSRIITEFRQHSCTTGCLPSRGFKGNFKNLALSRFFLFLQYQGVIDSSGWGDDDPDISLRFRQVLVSEGVGPGRADVQARSAIHFVLWLRLMKVHRSEINDGVIATFLDHSCDCGVHYVQGRLDIQSKAHRRVAVQRFVRFISNQEVVLRDNRLISHHKKICPTPVVERYRTWLDRKGIASRTAYYYVLDLMSWLPELGEDPSVYSATTIRALALSQFSKRSPAMQGRFIRSFRSYIGFCSSEGRCNPALAQALISRPTYRLSGIPRRLEPGMIAKIIESCDPKASSGLRDRAIITLLSELGLRAVEVWRLKLSDLDWVEAKMHIHGKGGRGAVVPLTQRSGDAILDYLEMSRPASNSASLFLRASRPHSPLANAAEISGIARKALARCGLRGGAHVFRHTLATELLRDGRSLEDVATVLRHRSLDTTAIYAKVNEPMLKRLASQWLGDGDD
ncbi:tyrosine-type recombinase/integrase [Sphingomonas prati]|uniref:Site-specific recombinase XerD n=1 Tax=Sphingomonas prati TaxID=1843237 RepID=A0A7W9BVJ5_9SPHN|nr:tyrosine-type recombinase/integrase [Sphingomonas prati]MBB5730919.1 site-specific recombinase XerD [Sphingomonas prati]